MKPASFFTLLGVVLGPADVGAQAVVPPHNAGHRASPAPHAAADFAQRRPPNRREALLSLYPLTDPSAPTVRIETPIELGAGGGPLPIVTSTETFTGLTLTNYSNPPSSLVSLGGQPGFEGPQLMSDPWVGAATDAVMLNIAPGAPGGVPPTGLLRSTGLAPGVYGALARRNGQDPLTTGFALAMNESFLPRIVTSAAPIVLSTDWHLLDATTSQWWSPTSLLEGCSADRVFFGGTEIGGLLAAFENAQGVLDRIVGLSRSAGNPFGISGACYSAPESPLAPFPVGQWFSLMEMCTVGPDGLMGQSLWLKTAETVANGFLDPRLASGLLTPNDGDPLGWVNLIPGIDDDPMTPQIEGLGRAVSALGDFALNTGHAGQSPPLAKVTLTVVQYGEGLDPSASVVPGFLPNDAFIDNTTISGALMPSALRLGPDGVYPFLDDFSAYIPDTPPHIQNGNAAIDGVFIPPMISPDGPDTQHLVLAAGLADQNYRVGFGSESFPRTLPRVRAQAGAPLVAGMRVLITGTPGVTTREIAVHDADGLGALRRAGHDAAVVVFGAVDPIDGVGAADGQVWVRQPNPGFNLGSEWQDHLVEPHWRPPAGWAVPPAGGSFNTRSILVPTGVAHPVDTFFDLRFEIEPDPLNPTGPAVLRVFVAGAEVFPNGDPAQRFVAASIGATSIRFASGQNPGNAGDVMRIDDVFLDGPQPLAPGSPFLIPYVDGFDGYDVNAPIDGQGPTTFLDPASMPTSPVRHFFRRLTVIPDAAATPAPGDLVCRYQVDSTLLGSGAVAVGQTIAVDIAGLPPELNPTLSQQVCPGSGPGPAPDPLTPPSAPVPTPYVVRPSAGAVRLETGQWSLLNTNDAPVAFNPNQGDTTGFRFDFTLLPRWSVAPTQFLIESTLSNNNLTRVVDTAAALPGVGAPGDRSLELVASEATDGALNDFAAFQRLDAILPIARAVDTPGFSNPDSVAQLAFDVYVEGLDATGAPSDSAPPRARFAVEILAPGGVGPLFETPGKITSINFGGPHVNERSALINSTNPPPILTDDLISVEIPSEIPSPSTQFESTGVSLLTGGMGLNGVITGPLINRWIRVIVTVDAAGDWTLALDEDRDGPAASVLLATGSAVDAGQNGTNLAGVHSLRIWEGRDLGGGEEPATLRSAHVSTLPGGAAAAAPANADPTHDYCFYTITRTDFEDTANPAIIFDPGVDFFGVPIGFRPLSPNNDVIAVLNRRTDGAGNTFGPLIHDPCPWDLTTEEPRFDLTDAATGQVVYRGRWIAMGLVGFAGVETPPPAGGISIPDGPSQTPPVQYNDFTLLAQGGAGVRAPQPIFLTEWATDSTNGYDPVPPILPPQRWLMDTVALDVISTIPCADLSGDGIVDGADISFILNQFGGSGSADLNGDGVINSGDISFILNAWGPCP